MTMKVYKTEKVHGNVLNEKKKNQILQYKSTTLGCVLDGNFRQSQQNTI